MSIVAPGEGLVIPGKHDLTISSIPGNNCDLGNELFVSDVDEVGEYKSMKTWIRWNTAMLSNMDVL